KDAQGLAHFLEHLLFLGTEKYPDVEDYKMYLSNNGGYSNAYTAEDHTNYLFEVIHEAYEGALDRFAQFFIAPAFNPDYTTREQNAVNSEFQKNLEHDYWRMRQIKRNIYNSDHPSNHFEIGSLETLEKVDRQVLLDFHKKYYSANQMALALLSKYPIADMEIWAHTYFSEIKNNQAPDIEYPPVYLSEKDALRLIRVKPVKDKKELGLEFPLPIDLYQYYDSKPMSILGSLMGHEGKGSLLSFLKDKGLATGLNGGGSPDTPDYGSAGVNIQLTEKGVSNYQEVLGYFFSYVDMLKKEGFKNYIFNEQQTIAKLEEVYSDKGEGAWKAISFANNLAFYPMDIAHRVEYHFGNPDPEAYLKVLSYIHPKNMLCVLSDSRQETPLEEFWYKSNYNYEEIEGSVFDKLSAPTMYAELHLPEPNLYLPENANLLSGSNNVSQDPILLEDSEGLKLYWGRDTDFQRPKASYRYKIYSPEKFTDLRSQVLMTLYIAAVNESMNEASYPAKLAGMNYNVSNDAEGISIVVNGYSDSIDDLLKEVLLNMKNISIPEGQFEALRDKMIRDWKNVALGNATGIAREGMRKMLRKYYYNSPEMADEAGKMTLFEVKEFSKALLKKGYIEGLIYGNVSESQARVNTDLFTEILKIKPEKWQKVIHQGRLDFTAGEDITQVLKTQVNNSCLWRLQYFGENSIEEAAQAQVIGNFVGSPFFLEMRTNQQLGYIVWGGAASAEKSSYFYFIIQSGNHPAEYLANQAEQFSLTLPDSLRQLPEEDFLAIKNSVIEKIKEKPTSIEEQAGKYYTMAFDYNGNFNRNEELIQAVENLTREKSVEVLAKVLANETLERATVLLYAKEHNVGENIKSSFDSINQWKNTRKYQ
ncbi:MAG TPA: insulinase family protein, partial [Candidatus Marinimicrobia bacterium]|nr:insulinase family protein [Candidatus Neomarinimicrobiota bacterium]